MFRIGLGQDSHKFELKSKKAKKSLILGGIVLKNNNLEIKANSDGDVILHSLFNALSSAVGKESIGKYADLMCKEQGITDSKEYIKVAIKLVRQAGFKINNVSIAVEAKQPRIDWKQQDEIKKTISQLLKIKPSAVGITFTSGESLTPFGQGKGIQVFSIVSLKK